MSLLTLPAADSSLGESSGAGRKRRLDVQGLRAVAVLMVVSFHAGLPVPGGFVGVDVFFVISGFVIAAMLQREWATTGRIRFVNFYVRRFKRLTPALAIMVSVTMLLSAFVLSPFGTQQRASKGAIGTMLLAANAVIARTTGGYFDASAETNPLLNTWSLAVEEQFYILFPLVLVVGWLLARRARLLKPAPFVIVGGIASVSFALAVLGSTGYQLSGSDWLIHFYSPLTRAWEFAAGAILALAATRVRLRSRRVAFASGLLGTVMLGACLWLINGATPFPGPWTLLPVAGTVLLILAGTNDANPITRALATVPMVKIGDWSYSIYLWHWPLIVFATLLWPQSPAAPVAAALISFAPAIASYIWVEQPIRLRAPRSHRRFAGLVAATVVPPLALAALLGVGARAQWWMSWPISTSTPTDHVAMARGCTDQPFDPVRCAWHTGAANGRVLLAGDSQAYADADGVIEAASRLGMSTVVSSRSTCPLSTVDTKGMILGCPAWQHRLLSYALETRPDVVVIANQSSGYGQAKTGWRTTVDKQGTKGTAAHAAALYGAGLDGVVKKLREARIGVVVLQDIPKPDRVDNETSILRRFFPIASPASFDPAGTIAKHTPWTGEEATVVRANPGAVLYDPLPALCPSGSCPFVDKGASVYLDNNHLTREGSLLLASSLRAAIQKAAQER